MRVFASLALAVSTIGCVAAEGDESFVIVHHQAPPSGTEECTFTADKTRPFLPSGIVHLSADSYFATPLLESRVQAAVGKESLRTIFIEGANVSLEVKEGGATTQSFQYQVLFTGALAPNGGLTATIYDLIPRSIMTEIKSTVSVDPFDLSAPDVELVAVATSTVFGDFYGDRLESAPYTFPVTITNTNLNIVGTCPINPTVTPLPEPTNACSTVQDTNVICCDDNGTAVCPPTILAP